MVYPSSSTKIPLPQMQLNNKNILITGASSGIGLACAKAFAKLEANLILIARRRDRLEKIQKELTKTNKSSVEIAVLDITNYSTAKDRLLELVSEKNIDILINNAGLAIGLDKIQDGEFSDWETMFNTNVLALLNVTRLILPNMLENNAGHIINIGSISSHEIYPGGTVYCATKHAEKAISKGMKMDLTGTNVRVTSIDPGMVETEFSIVRFNDTKKAKDVYRGMQPLSPQDVADCIVFTATRPPHVNITEMIMLPTAQSSTTLINRTAGE